MPSIYHKRVIARVLSLLRLSLTPRTVAHQAPLSLRFPRQEYWSGLPIPLPGDIPDPGIELASPASPAMQARLYCWATGEAQTTNWCYNSVPEVFPWLCICKKKKKSVVKCFPLLAQNKAKLTLLFLPVQPQPCLMIWIRVKKKKKREREKETPSPPPLQNPK